MSLSSGLLLASAAAVLDELLEAALLLLLLLSGSIMMGLVFLLLDEVGGFSAVSDVFRSFDSGDDGFTVVESIVRMVSIVLDGILAVIDVDVVVVVVALMVSAGSAAVSSVASP